MNDISQIREFLDQRRLAIVGVSREPKDFSRSLFREFRQRGYDLAPVNLEASEIEGQPCFAHLDDIVPPVDTVLIMTLPGAYKAVLEECAASGIKRVWMYRTDKDAIQFGELNGMSVIAGECPLMFLSKGAWIHRVHAFLRKITSSYPS